MYGSQNPSSPFTQLNINLTVFHCLILLFAIHLKVHFSWSCDLKIKTSSPKGNYVRIFRFIFLENLLHFDVPIIFIAHLFVFFKVVMKAKENSTIVGNDVILFFNCYFIWFSVSSKQKCSLEWFIFVPPRTLVCAYSIVILFSILF